MSPCLSCRFHCDWILGWSCGLCDLHVFCADFADEDGCPAPRVSLGCSVLHRELELGTSSGWTDLEAGEEVGGAPVLGLGRPRGGKGGRGMDCYPDAGEILLFALVKSGFLDHSCHLYANPRSDFYIEIKM